jgi:hypothetical protein
MGIEGFLQSGLDAITGAADTATGAAESAADAATGVAEGAADTATEVAGGVADTATGFVEETEQSVVEATDIIANPLGEFGGGLFG